MAINQVFEAFFVVINRDYKDWVLIILNILFSNNANIAIKISTIYILIYHFIKYGILLIPIQTIIFVAISEESSLAESYIDWLVGDWPIDIVPAYRLGSSNFLLWLMLLSLSTSIQPIWFLFSPWMAYSGKHPMAVIAMSDPPGLTQRSVFNFLAVFLTPSAKCTWNSSHTYMERLWNCAPGQGSHIFCSQNLTRSSWIQCSGYVYAIAWAIFLPLPFKKFIQKTMCSFDFVLLVRQCSFLFLLVRVVFKLTVKIVDCGYSIHVPKTHKLMLKLSNAHCCQLRVWYWNLSTII